jgi:hypothetical protein
MKSMPKISKETKPQEQPKIEDLNIADLYKSLVAKTVAKKTSAIPSADVYKHLNDLFEESGQSELMFAPAQRVVKTLMGSSEKNFYNRAMSAVKAKASPFEVFEGEDGHVYIRKKAVQA